MNNKEISITLDNIYDKFETKITIGDNMILFQKKHFNWFRKLMYKIVFDIKIEDLKGEAKCIK